LRKLGFIGTGAITSAIVTGLNSPTDAGYAIRISPRNPEVASDLAARFPAVSIAASNQEVLDWCDTAVIAVRPQIVREVLAELSFRPDHHVISLVSGLPVRQISPLVSPALRIARAVPLPSTAKRRGPTGVFPADRDTMELFAKLGTAIAAETETEFDVICAATATLASYFAFAGAVASWLEGNGIPAANAREYVGVMFAGLAGAAVDAPELSFDALARDHATRGGINEQVLARLSARGVFTALSDELDAVLRRITQKA